MTIKYIVAFLGAAVASIGGAWVCADILETRTAQAVKSAIIDDQHDFVKVATDGLLVILTGEAPDEAKRFRAVSTVGHIVDSDRIVDQMDVKARASIAPPRFVVEMLRNSDGISLIGLVPEKGAGNSNEIAEKISAHFDGTPVTDLLETANYPAPAGWRAAIKFSVDALNTLPRSKISASADAVYVTAISDSPDDKRRIERKLNRAAPDDMRLVLKISAPRPVITPFTLRFTLNEDGGKFDACSADTPASRARILAAAQKAGLTGKAECEIGLGVPSPNWSKAVEVALAGLKDLGGGSLTFSDADVTLVARDTTAQNDFDRVVGELEGNLPGVFSLHAVLPEKVVVDGTGESKAVEFVATRSPEGLVQLRGRLPGDSVKRIVSSYAKAKFGSKKVYVATRNDDDLPEDWPMRALAALESLAELESGSAVVQAEYVEIRGISGRKSASDRVSRMLADKLGDAENFEIAVRYDEMLDPTLNIPTPQECVDRINKILSVSKIAFEPASAEISEAAGNTMDQIAEIAKQCERAQIEIGGHTDSQGREVMNKALSQQRADAVLAALLERRVRTRNMTAKGYGEAVPIANNKTEEGREANRRIEFKLLNDARAAADGNGDGDEGKDDKDTPQDKARDKAQDKTPEKDETDKDETAGGDKDAGTGEDADVSKDEEESKKTSKPIQKPVKQDAEEETSSSSQDNDTDEKASSSSE